MKREARLSKDDVEKLIRGQPSKSRSGSRQIRHRLRQDELERLTIARQRGYLLLTQSTRTALRNAWFLDCQARQRPCLYVERTTAGFVVTGVADSQSLHTTLSDLDSVSALILQL